jgi:hypothetical protein
VPCLLVVLALLAPRVALVLLWLFSSVLDNAFASALWPVLGFIFMPFLTIAYAFAVTTGGGVQGIWLAIVIIAALADLGAIGGQARSRSRG